MKKVVAALALVTAACSGRANLGSTLGGDAGGGRPSASGGATSSGGGATGAGGGGAPVSVGREAGAALASGGTSDGTGGGSVDASSATGGTGGGGDASSGAGGTTTGDGGAAGAAGKATGTGGVGSNAGGTTTGAGGTGGDRGRSDSGLPPADVWLLCHDNLQDGDESDIDCGGSCRPCARAQKCLSDADCSKTAPGCDTTLGGCACDPVTGTCAASHCVDERKDSTEGDIDCGGECTRCNMGQHCNVDYDCSWTDPECAPSSCTCDSLTGACIANHCLDHHRNSNESDVDCGGGAPCARCPPGATCNSEYDCASRACDGITRVCVSDGCTDHAVDGNETDIDCGGGTCGACGTGKWCTVNGDCLGNDCPTSYPHMCR